MDILGHRPRDRDAVERRRAASDLIEKDETVNGRVVENVRRLVHLDEKRALAGGEVILRADAREDLVYDTDRRARRRHERADLRKQNDEPHLSKQRALARHVRTGEYRYLIALGIK